MTVAMCCQLHALVWQPSALHVLLAVLQGCCLPQLTLHM